MSPDLRLVLHLQDLDNQIRELQKEISALPKHIAEIEKTLDVHTRKWEADKAALQANQRERKSLEGDIQMQEQKVSRLRDQMMSAKTNEQYRAFQKEIEYCQNEIRKMEDRILALMEESEPLEANVRQAEAALKEERRRVENEKAAARERTAQDKRAVEELQRQREEVVRQLTPAIYAAYEKIRAKRGGIAVAEASDGRCSACHIALRPQFFQDLRRLEQGVMFCETCGRILYYQPPVAVEDPAADTAAPAS